MQLIFPFKMNKTEPFRNYWISRFELGLQFFKTAIIKIAKRSFD